MSGLLLIHGKMLDRVTDNEYQVGFLSRGTEAPAHRWVMNKQGLVHLYSDQRLGNGPHPFFFLTCQHLGENGLKGTTLCKGWVPFGLMWRVRVHVHRWELRSAAIAHKDSELYSIVICGNTSTLPAERGSVCIFVMIIFQSSDSNDFALIALMWH